MLTIIKEISEGIWAMDHAYARNYRPFIMSMLKGDFNRNNFDLAAERQKHIPTFASLDVLGESEFDYGDYKEWLAAPADFDVKGPAVVMFNITGPITKYDQPSGGLGMATYAKWLDRAYSNKHVKAIVLKIDSGGGDGHGSDLMAETIRRSPVPVIGFAEDVAASAAYQILAACNIVIANNNTALIGSIGTYVTLINDEKALEKEGYEVIEIYADESSEKNKEYYDALEGKIGGMKARVNRWNDEFINGIIESRGTKLKNDSWRKGKLFFAEEAIKIGLIDEIRPFNEVMKDLFTQLNIQ